jgi:hypothetical protein
MPQSRLFPVVLLPLLLVLQGAPADAGTEEKDPAKVEISISPDRVAPGGTAEVTVRIVPGPGIKVNRYPKIKLTVAAQENVVLGSEASVGNSSGPPEGQPEANYFHDVDPLRLELRVAERATSGPHRVPGKLTYFYCVAASGYCAPARVSVEIPVTVR